MEFPSCFKTLIVVITAEKPVLHQLLALQWVWVSGPQMVVSAIVQSSVYVTKCNVAVSFLELQVYAKSLTLSWEKQEIGTNRIIPMNCFDAYCKPHFMILRTEVDAVTHCFSQLTCDALYCIWLKTWRLDSNKQIEKYFDPNRVEPYRSLLLPRHKIKMDQYHVLKWWVYYYNNIPITLWHETVIVVTIYYFYC